MKNVVVILKNWQTSVLGVISIISGGLVYFGVIDAIDATDLAPAVSHLFDTVISLMLSILGLIGIFAKDGNKSSEDVGLKK